MTKNSNRIRMANAIRMLAADAVEKANSGHPGSPMGMADIAQVLWHHHLQHNPSNPKWINRDRFILSNGHGSMLLYALLHLSGYSLSMKEIQNFRQLYSLTPGHPEYDITPGVETTTGPLGQGLANAVGMALAEQQLAMEFNKPGHTVIDHLTYVFVGDGCLMEGISHEACSLAGTLGLSKLIVIYDDNDISIDGKVADWFSDDTPARFRSYGWNVIDNVDGHDFDDIHKAITKSKQHARHGNGKPTLICCKTIIGKGAPNKQGGEQVHGAPLGKEELSATRKALKWSHEPFVIPDDIAQSWNACKSGAAMEHKWQETFSIYQHRFPGEAKELIRRINGQLPDGFQSSLESIYDNTVLQARQQKSVATRKASQQTLDLLAPVLPELFGGSADLTSSNLTKFKQSVALKPGFYGNHLSYGVREFAMTAMINGMVLHGGYIAYGGTFLTFSDYCRNAIRLSALMKLRSIHVFTHDSIGLGEDGPTHQSVEHIPSLRMIPDLDCWRPCDALETSVAWVSAISRTDGPTALILSRQNLINIHTDADKTKEIERGGYVISDCEKPQAVILATGSEVSVALEAQKHLQKHGTQVRIVSMPCTQRFDRQDQNYQSSILPKQLPIVAIEAAHPDFWYKYIARSDRKGSVMGINSFGLSAPAKDLFQHFGITVEKLSEQVKLSIVK